MSGGKRCGRQAMTGGTVCYSHGGQAPQVRAAAARRAALADAVKVLGDLAPADPGDALDAALRVLQLHLSRNMDNAEAVDIATKLGQVAKAALDHGVAERRTRLESEQAQLVAAVVGRILEGVGVDPRLPRVVQVVTRELRAVEGSS